MYAASKSDQDKGNAFYQDYFARVTSLYSQFSEAVAFFEPELLSLPSDQVKELLASEKDLALYDHYFDDLLRKAPHTLTQVEEEMLAQASEVLSASSRTFGQLNNADFRFPTIQDEDGQTVELTHSLYSKFLESDSRSVRKATFEGFNSVYNQFKSTLASTLSTTIKANNFQAKVRKFDSARQAALFANNVPEAVYDTLVETVGSRVSLLHRYVALRQQLLELDDLEMYDMYTPLLGQVDFDITYEKAKDIVLKAVAPMGEDYVAIIQAAFDQRWIDVYENQGKRSGAYSSGTYDSRPYILLNWQDNISCLYTLIHELGHSAHSYLTHANQPYVYGDYSIFLAEIASTTNENLLTDYLLKEYTDPQIQLYILNNFLDRMKSTMFRQTQFAEFEHFMYTADAQGQPLTADYLSQTYQALNEKYYGPQVNSDSLIRVEWSRIPHFYYNYYVFQYATGFAAATYFADKICQGDQSALENYKNFLKSGKRYYPIETMKRAGLDMTQAEYIISALDVFEQRLNEFERALAENHLSN